MSAETVRPVFEKYAKGGDGSLEVQVLTEVLGELGLGDVAAPKELASYVKTVASNPMLLTFQET